MSTNQPKWQLVANLGDVNPFDHGAFFVWKDLTGVYDLEATSLTVCNNDQIIESRILLEKCYLTNGVLSDNKFHLDYSVWFSEDLPAIASFSGQDLDQLISDLCSDNPIERGSAYLSVFNYHGSQGDDNILTGKEVRAKYSRKYQGFCRRQNNQKKGWYATIQHSN